MPIIKGKIAKDSYSIVYLYFGKQPHCSVISTSLVGATQSSSSSLRNIPIFESGFLYDFIYASAMKCIEIPGILERYSIWSDELKSEEKICLLEQEVLN